MNVGADQRSRALAQRRDPARVAVVGGGFSGLAAAFYLQRAGHDPRVVEQAHTLGGRSAPVRLGGRSIVLGGKNVGKHYSRFREFTRSLGDPSYEPFGINSSRVEEGALVTVDSGRKLASVRTLLSQGSVVDFAKLAYLAARVRASEENRFLGSGYFVSLAERYDGRPVSAYFRPRFCARVVRPLTVRVNGAEPDEVFPGNFGTTVAMLLDSYDQLRPGIEPVLERFEERFAVALGTRAEELVVSDGAVRGLRVRTAEGALREEPYDAVVLATPARAAATLVQGRHRELAELLRDVRYFPAAVIVVEYDRPVFSEDLRAVVFDEGPLTNAGAYGMEDRHIVRYTFSGRAARPLLHSGADPAALLGDAEGRLARWFPVEAAERVHVAQEAWDAAYCAYLPYHSRFLAKLRTALRELPGLGLAGDYVHGASIEACFKAGEACAVEVDTALAAV
jgi:protoporphyrinogen/coproporphyrinogen III oxidase